MVKNKVNKFITKENIAAHDNTSIFKRFTMVFEGAFIALITVALLYLTHYVDIPEFVMQLSSQQHVWLLTEIITVTGILFFGLLLFFIRYSAYLRRKNKQQFIIEAEIKKLAFFDRLTNLPNQALCHNRLEHALARAARNNNSIAIFFISIENFTSINNLQGHDGGDKLLQQIAKRLSSELRPGDTLARIGSGEFIVIVESLLPSDNIDNIAAKLLTKLVKCYRVLMQEVYITSNIGIALYPNDGEFSKELINNADTARCFAKQQGLNSLAFFSKELQEQVNTKKKIAEQLQGAMERKELILHYQPIVAKNTNNIIGVEALLRWHNELLGNLAPDVFIPIAEDIGIITQIGDWVLAQACQQNKIWQEQGYPSMVLSINLSVMQLAIKNYATTVAASLAETQLAPEFLELEFTEQTLMKDVKKSMSQLKKLRTLGVSLALDDFGTGYSSMKYLPRFSLNRLKIDGCFVKYLPESAIDVMTIHGITALAKQLKLQITVEGVETAEQYEFIEGCSIDAMQGYHFSRPVSAEAFTKLLQAPSWQQT